MIQLNEIERDMPLNLASRDPKYQWILHAARGLKINAIKYLRAEKNIGLVDAKKIVTEYCEYWNEIDPHRKWQAWLIGPDQSMKKAREIVFEVHQNHFEIELTVGEVTKIIKIFQESGSVIDYRYPIDDPVKNPKTIFITGCINTIRAKFQQRG